MPAIGGILKALLFSWVGKLVTAEFIEWVILWGARELVKATETKHDDEFLAKVEEALKTGRVGCGK